MPIKINSSGVLPVIFASSVLAAPRTIVSFMKASSTTKMINTIFNYQEPVGFCLYILMIIGFTFFYSNLQIDAEKISDDLKKNGGSIPGVRTGIETKNFIKRVLNQSNCCWFAYLYVLLLQFQLLLQLFGHKLEMQTYHLVVLV